MKHIFGRREFVKLVGAGAAAATLPAIALGDEGQKDKPNVLFIAVDDLNDWIGCLGGHPGVKTPNLDRLAASGVLFTRAYCSSPLCNPSRTSLLTGVSPSTSGVYANDHPWRPAMPKAMSIPQYFRAQGYRVMGGGKIFHGEYEEKEVWHEYFERPKDPFPHKRFWNTLECREPVHWGPIDATDGDMGDFKLADWAIGILNRKWDAPFFLAAGFVRPHTPWFMPRKYFDLYPPEKVALPRIREDDLDDLPPQGKRLACPEGKPRRPFDPDEWRNAVAGYMSAVTFIDACIGRLIDALNESPHSKNTVLVLWSDQGFHLGEKFHWQKMTLWEESTHVPLIFVAPGVTKPGGRCPHTVSLLDIYPTLLDVCGLPQRAGLEGKSLLPLLKDPEAPWDRPALSTYFRNNHAVRSERWRYIRYRDGTEELYDHSNDEMEWTNLADRPEFAEVKKELAQWLPKENAHKSTKRLMLDSKRQERKKRKREAKKGRLAR